LLDDPVAYATWASDYHERPIAVDTVAAFQRLDPLDEKLVRALYPEAVFAALRDELDEIGYR